jgi:hypothetical protein
MQRIAIPMTTAKKMIEGIIFMHLNVPEADFDGIMGYLKSRP